MSDVIAARVTAIEWAKKVIEKPFVVLDLEATDKVPLFAEPVQVGIIRHDGKELVNTYLKPDHPMTPEAQKKTRIAPEWLESAPEFREAYPTIQKVIEGQIVLVYNVDYDRDVLRETCVRLQLPDITECASEWVDVMQPFAQFYGAWREDVVTGGDWRWQSLTTAAKTFGINTEGAHDAIADCHMTRRVVKAMAQTTLAGAQVFQFEDDYSVVLVNGTAFRMKGNRNDILEKIQNPAPATSLEVTEMDDATITDELHQLREDIMRYADTEAELAPMLDAQKKLEERIKERYLRLIAAGVESPHDALETAERKTWKMDESVIVPLARVHAPDLIVERIDQTKLSAMREAGLLWWLPQDIAHYNVNRFARFARSALKLIQIGA